MRPSSNLGMAQAVSQPSQFLELVFFLTTITKTVGQADKLSSMTHEKRRVWAGEGNPVIKTKQGKGKANEKI